MLRVDPKARPSCGEILDTDFVRAKCEELGVDLNDTDVAAYDTNNHMTQAEQ